MKAFLMYRDQDFDFQCQLPWNEQALIQDLELNTLFNAMSLGDAFLFEVAKKAVLCGLNSNVDTILYRQDILKDCLSNSSIVRDMYNTAVEAIEGEKKALFFSFFLKYPGSILHRSVEVLQVFVNMLMKLMNIANEHAHRFESEGFKAFFAMLRKELSGEYFDIVQNHLKELKFREGVLISAKLGKGNKDTEYTLRKIESQKQSWACRIFGKKSAGYAFSIADRDESGTRALSELRDRGINLVANAVAQSADHINSFFVMLRTELAFYIGCLNLHEKLSQIGGHVSFPIPASPVQKKNSFQELYDICLSLTIQQKIVGNTVNADNKNLVIITGANQGGKSTFLRSIGLSQLMMQCGLFVPAESFCSAICDGLFTHYKREEDTTMKSGKLDEELARMSDIVDNIMPNSLLLFNESFAATNEREGSEIARQIVSGLLENGTRIFFVSHLYQFAYGFLTMKRENQLFLRAERKDDGTRTFKLAEGEPLETSYGEDLYKEIFGKAVLQGEYSKATNEF
jgi:DNA mismatch repair ATPase MutS